MNEEVAVAVEPILTYKGMNGYSFAISGSTDNEGLSSTKRDASVPHKH
jgi:hypothetical protein